MFSLLSVTLSALMIPGPQHSLDGFRQELAGAGAEHRSMPTSPVGLQLPSLARELSRN